MLFFGKLEHEIFWKTFLITLNLPIHLLYLYLIKHGQISVY